MSYLFSSEAVSPGHPDKLCDQISDMLLDRFLAADPTSRVAIETVAAAKQIHVFGEVSSAHKITTAEVDHLVRKLLQEVGYTAENFGADFWDPKQVLINTALQQQSPDIAQAVTTSLEFRDNPKDPYDRLGAGDQGIMFGYATRELENLKLNISKSASFMPSCSVLAQQLARSYNEYQLANPLFGPDAKTQVTIKYEKPGAPIAVDTVLLSAQHSPALSVDTVRKTLCDELIYPLLHAWGVTTLPRVIINPGGVFTLGGPISDTGLTGRKIVVDSYGGYAPHGGGAFSGKDPSKVDRSAAYAARWVAKNLVANSLCDTATVQLAYAIGSAYPVSVQVCSDSPELDEKLAKIVADSFDLRPAAIIDRLGLVEFHNYSKTAVFGHFGRTDLQLPWEEVITL